MEDRKAIRDDQMDAVSGGKGEKQNLIKSLYDSSTQFEIAVEKEIDRIEGSIAGFFRQENR